MASDERWVAQQNIARSRRPLEGPLSAGEHRTLEEVPAAEEPKPKSGEQEIWRAARFLILKYGAEAGTAVARCADALEASGEREACSFIGRVLDAIIELRKSRPRCIS